MLTSSNVQSEDGKMRHHHSQIPSNKKESMAMVTAIERNGQGYGGGELSGQFELLKNHRRFVSSWESSHGKEPTDHSAQLEVGLQNNLPGIVNDRFRAHEESPSTHSSGLVQFVFKLLEDWKLEESDAVNLLGYEKEEMDYVLKMLHEMEPLRGRDVKFRISKLFYIRQSLWSFFQDLEVENEWLREPQTMLDDQIPISMIRSGQIESLMLVEEYVDMITGM